jgi:hypothetical protein
MDSLILGQERFSSITGIVLNKSNNQPVVLANVSVIGSAFGASTDTAGKFVISQIPPGSYDVRISALGFGTTIVRNISVIANQSTKLDLSLTEQYVQMSDVVTVGNQRLNVPELSISTHFLDYREIQHTAGAFDDVLRTITILPGVAQTRIDRNDLSVRGGSPAENLNVIDGFEIENINHFGTEGSGGGSTTFLNLDFVENSFFSGGGFGVPYGDKLSSVLSIDMREGRNDRFRSKATISATQAGLNLDGPITDNGSFLFSARRSYLDPFFKLYGYSFAPYFWDFLGKATYRLSGWDKVEVLGVGVIDRIHRFDDTPQDRADNDARILEDQTTALGGIKWQHGFDDGFFSAIAQHSYGDYRYEQVGNNIYPHLYHNSYEGVTSVKLDAFVKMFSSTEINAGVGANVARLFSSFHTTIIPTGYSNDSLILPINISDDTSGHKFSTYLQISQALGDLILTAGARADYFSMIREGWVVAPRFSASYTLTASTRINGTVGRYEQSPAYIWLMANPYNRGLTHIGMDQYVLGIEHTPQNDLSITLEVYLKNYDNYPVSLTRPYIVLVNSGAEIEAIAEAYASFGLDYLQSSGTGSSRGVELFIQKRVSDSPLYGRLSVTYSETQFTALDGVSRPSSLDQRWKVTMNGGYAFDEKWEFNSAFHFATGRPYTPFGPSSFTRSRDDYNETRTGANHSLDVRMSRKWSGKSTVTTLFLDIQNVYNKKPSEPPVWNQSKRVWEQASTLGILPSIGVSVEF